MALKEKKRGEDGKKKKKARAFSRGKQDET